VGIIIQQYSKGNYMPKTPNKRISPALSKAAKDLQNGSGDAGLALAERKKILKLAKETKSKPLTKKR
jgi:hypothetical protein